MNSHPLALAYKLYILSGIKTSKIPMELGSDPDFAGQFHAGNPKYNARRPKSAF